MREKFRHGINRVVTFTDVVVGLADVVIPNGDI